MGIEYVHYALPRHGARPAFDRVLAFVRAAQRDRWLPDPASPGFKPPQGWATYHALAAESGAWVRTSDGTEHAVPREIDVAWLEQRCSDDAIIGWHVDAIEATGLRYPLVVNAWGAEASFELELHFCPSFVYRASEIIQPFPRVTCACGKDLEDPRPPADIFYSSRIHARCPACSTLVDPERFTAQVEEPSLDGDEVPVPGGCTYRFAVVVDCNKATPPYRDLIRLEPELLALCKRELGVSFYEIGDWSF